MSAYLMIRYGVYNLLWSLSGEYQYSLRDCGWSSNQISEMGGVVQAHNTYGHPISIHPSGRIDWTFPHGEQSSLAYIENSWLDHTWLQTGQSRDRMFNIVTRSMENYNRKPIKPVFLSESFYERESDPDHVYHTRWQVWSAFLNGALGGYGYGAVGIWNFFEPNEPLGETGKNVKNTIPWQRALHLKGSTQIQSLSKLLKNYQWWHLKPCRELIEVDGNRNILPSPDNIKPISGARMGNTLFIFYLPRGNQDKNIGILNTQNTTFKMIWFNPRNGNKVDTQYFFSEKGNWVIPEPPDPREDWVLVLEKGEES
jgi:hypothetical protein